MLASMKLTLYALPPNTQLTPLLNNIVQHRILIQQTLSLSDGLAVPPRRCAELHAVVVFDPDLDVCVGCFAAGEVFGEFGPDGAAAVGGCGAAGREGGDEGEEQREDGDEMHG